MMEKGREWAMRLARGAVCTAGTATSWYSLSSFIALSVATHVSCAMPLPSVGTAPAVLLFTVCKQGQVVHVVVPRSDPKGDKRAPKR